MIAVQFLGVGAALPAPGATNSAYLLSVPGATLLVDCGPAILQQFAAVNRSPGEVSHVLVTHRHGDHALGYPMLLLWWKLVGLGQGIRPPIVAASAITWESLDALSANAYGELTGEVTVNRMVLADRRGASRKLASGVSLRTWPMKHSAFAPVLSMRIEAEGKSVAFTGDTTVCDTMIPLAKGADLLVCDSCHAATVAPAQPDGTPYHLTARQAGRYAREAGVRRLALVHIGAEYAGHHEALVAEAQAEFAGEVFAATAGQVVTMG